MIIQSAIGVNHYRHSYDLVFQLSVEHLVIVAEIVVAFYLMRRAKQLVKINILVNVPWLSVTGIAAFAALVSLIPKALHAGNFVKMILAALLYGAVYAGGLFLAGKYSKREVL